MIKMDLPRLYVIGDSISIHYGPYLERYVRGVFAYSRKRGGEKALLNLDNPQGANGGDSSMVLDFLKVSCKSGGLDADIVLLNCGLHDIKTDPKTRAKQVPIEQYRSNLRCIIALVRRLGPELIWIRTTPCAEAVHNHFGVGFYRFSADCELYNTVADKIMASLGVKVIDLYGFTRNLGPNLYCDHVHFHEHIREKQAAYIAGWLENWKCREL